MILKLKNVLLSLIAIALVTVAIPTSVFAAGPGPCEPGFIGPVAPGACSACPERVFTFPAWYRGIIDTGTCEIKIVNIMDFVKIPLNAIEILIQAVAYVAVGYVIWGGFKYIKSQGDPGKISEAKTAIINALTGLGIALASVAIVEFIQGRIV